MLVLTMQGIKDTCKFDVFVNFCVVLCLDVCVPI